MSEDDALPIRQQFRTKWRYDELDEVDVEENPFGGDGKTLTNEWIDWYEPAHSATTTALIMGREFRWERYPLFRSTLGDLVKDRLKPRLAFDTTGNTRTVVTVREVRDALLAEYLISHIRAGKRKYVRR